MRGVSSDTPFLPSKLPIDSADIVFLPTVSKDVASAGKARIYAVKWDGRDYIIATRPLYVGLDVVSSEAGRLRARGFKVVISLVAGKLSEYIDLLEKLGGNGDMVEVDLGLFYALYGYRRGFESYALDILEELVPVSPAPLVAKFSPNMPLSREFLVEVEKIGVNMLVFSTHPVYTVGGEIFRVHSTHLSLIYGSLWSSLVSEGLNSTKFITLERGVEPRGNIFSGILYDTALIMDSIGSGPVENEFPTRWLRMPSGMLPMIIARIDECRLSCPLKAFEENGVEEGTVTANPEKCDLCGLCLSLCGQNVVLARELRPQ